MSLVIVPILAVKYNFTMINNVMMIIFHLRNRFLTTLNLLTQNNEKMSEMSEKIWSQCIRMWHWCLVNCKITLSPSKETLNVKSLQFFHFPLPCQMSMSVKSLYSTSVLLRPFAGTPWAHTTALAIRDILMLTPATLEQIVQVNVCGWVV